MFKKEKFTGQKACVLGLGKSGRAAAALLRANGFEVLISEEAAYDNISALTLPQGVEVEVGGHTEKVFSCGFWIKSPGIFPYSPILEEARKRKIPVFSELEVALSFMPKNIRVFAVTGTNGKTTTTALLGEILKEDALTRGIGRKVHVCGNIGSPVSACALDVKRGDDVVIEVSSYQLEDSTYFRPNYACILNVTPDHLDHHGGMKNYIKAKGKVFKNQRENDVLVVNGADVSCAELVEKAKGEVLAFSTHPKHLLKTDVFFDGDELIFSEGHQIRPPQLKGIHNVENAMAAALMALSAGVAADTVQKVFNRFQAMEHRIEHFAYHRGVIYVNDSKATNLDSTVTALKSFEKCHNLWLILGGRDKGASYEVLLPYLKEYCKRVLTIGEAMDKIERELKGYSVTRCGTLERAVETAMRGAAKGDIVILSPACSSFDQFKDFEERGRVFKRLVDAHIFKERTDKKK
ncbi:MAG: UDP-N-acetylmuramoyl-L-alanine--D-glutamate ligase [Candidatus Avelusimicrobium sp.]|uniref:UDP-N-acetylmuramoyl-L-alanine--D-glutamate ligase n=1 Tax=Candidatus Avelusimicrobium sp. TaxID=3048833 RepID=UPI003F103771